MREGRRTPAACAPTSRTPRCCMCRRSTGTTRARMSIGDGAGRPASRISTRGPEGIAGVDTKQLAHHGVEIFFTRGVPRFCFMPTCIPANIFVSSERPVPGGGISAIMGTLSERDQHYPAENFLAFFQSRLPGVAAAEGVRARPVGADSDIRSEEFEAAIWRRVRTDFRQA